MEMGGRRSQVPPGWALGEGVPASADRGPGARLLCPHCGPQGKGLCWLPSAPQYSSAPSFRPFCIPVTLNHVSAPSQFLSLGHVGETWASRPPLGFLWAPQGWGGAPGLATSHK